MATARRRIIRPAQASPTAAEMRRQELLEKRRTQLTREQESLARWMRKLKRAFHAVERQQQKINRLERQLAGSGNA